MGGRKVSKGLIVLKKLREDLDSIEKKTGRIIAGEYLKECLNNEYYSDEKVFQVIPLEPLVPCYDRKGNFKGLSQTVFKMYCDGSYIIDKNFTKPKEVNLGGYSLTKKR